VDCHDTLTVSHSDKFSHEIITFLYEKKIFKSCRQEIGSWFEACKLTNSARILKCYSLVILFPLFVSPFSDYPRRILIERNVSIFVVHKIGWWSHFCIIPIWMSPNSYEPCNLLLTSLDTGFSLSFDVRVYVVHRNRIDSDLHLLASIYTTPQRAEAVE
jgi:hypothetical protein